jgi:uncharacterized membrane protein YqiK
VGNGGHRTNMDWSTLEFLVGVVVLVLLVFLVWGLFLIGDAQIGVLTRRMAGRPMPQGQVIARGGQVGVQAATLVPGLYWRMPIVWRLEKFGIIEIPEDKVGVVEAIDGLPLPKGRVFGNDVDCNSFQDAEAFFRMGGHKGPQVGVLRPGKYRVNPRACVVKVADAVQIGEGHFGVVTAQDGLSLPSNLLIAPPSDAPHNSFQNGQGFLDGKGYRGTQLDTLQPGLYYINPMLFDVRAHETYEVAPGTVTVLRSNVGAELVTSTTRPGPVGTPERSITGQLVHDSVEMLTPLTSDRLTRGIWDQPLAPGKYNLNPDAYTPYSVPTSAVMIDWGNSAQPPVAEEFFKFGPLGVTSKDGFPIAVEVRLVTRIDARNAAFVIARFGSIQNLIQQIIHPVIDAEFRNNAGQKKALEFVQSRADLQSEALAKAKDAFGQYNVEAQNLLISQIGMPKDLMDTQTQKEIAAQQQAQYEQQAAAEEKRIAVQEKKARADLQPQVVTAALQVEINRNNANAAIETAKGQSESLKLVASGERERLMQNGQGQAAAVEAVGLATAKAYEAQNEAIGRENVALIQVIQRIAEGQVQITPQTLISSGSGDASGSLLTAWLVRQLGSNGGPPSARPATGTASGKDKS